MNISCNVMVVAVMACWSKSGIQILMDETQNDSGTRLPWNQLSADVAIPADCLATITLSRALASPRMHEEQLPVITRLHGSADASLSVLIPFLVLVPRDVIREGQQRLLRPLADAHEAASGVEIEILEAAKEKIRIMVGSTTASLNMMGSFFSTVDLRLIHQEALGGPVNRMSLRKRYNDTGYIVPTGSIVIEERRGHNPQEMTPTIDKIHSFGVMIGTGAK